MYLITAATIFGKIKKIRMIFCGWQGDSTMPLPAIAELLSAESISVF